MGLKILNLFKKNSIDPQGLLEGIGKGIDKANFTKEERADFNLKVADKAADFVGNTLSENTIRSKTRRKIAIFVVYNDFAIFWLCVILKFLEKDIKPIIELVKVFNLSVALIVVLSFFFGGYYLKNVNINRKNDK